MANKTVNDKQLTIVWHVDDLKVSHVDKKVVDNFIKWLRDTYENNIGTVKVKRGKKFDYLGMTLDFSKPDKVKIDMREYVKKMIDDFPNLKKGKAKTPAANHLFNVREDVKKLSEKDAIIFHNLTARGLFLSKRARPDIQTAIAFLSTRVINPDEDDWKKLQRLILYLQGTKEMVLTLSADKAWIFKWYVDAAYAVHPDMKGHTGGMLTLGKGATLSGSVKQKMNAKSSTEAELIGCDDFMGHIIWTNYFLESQGYKSNDTILFQDNKSAILLEKNGKASSSKRTRHINIRYFFIKDRIENNELKVKYCPTDQMIADFFSKAVQGKNFFNF